MCFSEWLAYQLRALGTRGGHIAIFCHWTTHWFHWDWLGFRWNGSFHTGGEGHRGRMEVCVCLWVEAEYEWDDVFTTKRGCERKNWPSTELWFHFGDIESLDRTSEATKEQFSVPITAHSSRCDCCVAVISLVGGRRAAAESLHKNSLPVALAWEAAYDCLCLHWRLQYLCSLLSTCECVFTCVFLTCSPAPHQAVSLRLRMPSPSHFSLTNSSRETKRKNWLSLHCRAANHVFVIIYWVCCRRCLGLSETFICSVATPM